MTGLIYTVTAVPDENGGRCRCLGYYNTYGDLLNQINKYGINGLDEGGLFKYLVVEKFEAGIYAYSIGAEIWFEADHSNNSWVEMLDKPDKFKGIINFGMG
jgi:hypothetical protein